jgi:Fe2+ transport system protein FeoA
MVATNIASTSLLDLSHLGDGCTGIVERIAAEEATAKRLADMGFGRGAAVTKLRSGKPCLVRIAGTCVGLGLPLQKAILLAPAECPLGSPGPS